MQFLSYVNCCRYLMLYFCIAYSVVERLNVSFSGLIPSVEEECSVSH